MLKLLLPLFVFSRSSADAAVCIHRICVKYDAPVKDYSDERALYRCQKVLKAAD
jgi:uncharacterized membrane protein YbaN (DUF454 family)